ncbi:MAG: SMC-Scp complex subunit ScpB [Pirellulales bacterium]|nr:SMC-Scp complex subunit ScpB [Pirellulales bacterium]
MARRSRLEAVLFLTREPLSLRKMAQLANLGDATEARMLVKNLRETYDRRGSAFQIAQVAGGYQLLTRREFAQWLRPHGKEDREIRLSPPALETLAVVAYRQPVLRAEIEAVRGVACGELLHVLMERDLVRIAGRSEELGRPFQYGTTKHFLAVFGLNHLEDLPGAAELCRLPLGDGKPGHSTGDFSSSADDLTDGNVAA